MQFKLLLTHKKKSEYLDSKMTIQDCYKIANYIAIPARIFMKVVPHEASIRLGNKVIFQRLPSANIPTYYYNLASYEDLGNQKSNPKPLTDYIGRIESASPVLTRVTGTRIKKVTCTRDYILDRRHVPLQQRTSN